MQKNNSNINLCDLLDDYIAKTINGSNLKIISTNASHLITFNRLDIGFKLLYLHLRKKNLKLAEKIYLNHISSLSFGTFKEKGNPNKKKPTDFVINYENLISSFKNKNFDKSISIIPIENNNSILNGSHRLAISIYNNKSVPIVSLKKNKLTYDYKFFENRNIKKQYLEEAVKIFTKYDKNSYLAILWPSSYKYHHVIEKDFKKIIYIKRIKLTEVGKHNFIIELYKNEKWLGNYRDDFIGAINKKNLCFSNNKDLKIIIFQSTTKEEVDKLKYKLRKKASLGKNSVHISDDNNFQHILNILFSEESLNFINMIKYSKLKTNFTLTNKLKELILKKNLDIEDFIISGSFIMSLYNLRKNNDIDLINSLKLNSEDLSTKNLYISDHNKYIKYYNKSKYELIYNQSNYLYFNNIKIVNLKNIINFKKNRNENKDKIDNLLINKYYKIRHNKIKIKFYIIKISYFYAFLRYRIILFLIKVKLYKIIKTIFK